MKSLKSKVIIAACLVIIVLSVATISFSNYSSKPTVQKPTSSVGAFPSVKAVASPVISFVGPRENIPTGAPKDYGFWSFAVPVSGVLSRSGQPLLAEFEWLRDQGWRGDVDLRADGEYGEISDDSKIPGFNALGFHYLYLPIADGSPPTNKQAEQFLDFATNPINQPLHVHCRGGIGRAGTMVALYRYSVQAWPVSAAIEESRPFKGGISESQVKWLQAWAKEHKPGSFAR